MTAGFPVFSMRVLTWSSHSYYVKLLELHQSFLCSHSNFPHIIPRVLPVIMLKKTLTLFAILFESCPDAKKLFILIIIEEDMSKIEENISVFLIIVKKKGVSRVIWLPFWIILRFICSLRFGFFKEGYLFP